jgi:polyphosphate kinase
MHVTRVQDAPAERDGEAEDLRAPEHFLNRELSWLDFNARVQAEAERSETPLLERARFLGIVSNNLDEFFMVRAAMVHRAVEADAGPLGPDRTHPTRVLSRISEKAHALVARQYDCLHREVLPALAGEGVCLVGPGEYTAEDRAELSVWFEERVAPVLTPLAVDRAHPFPLIANCALFLLLRIRPEEDYDRQFYSRTDTVLMQVPSILKRFVRLPGEAGRLRFARLEDVVVQYAGEVLRGYAVEGAWPFRITRDADITVDEEQAENLLSALERQLRDRRHGAAVRLEVEAATPEEIVAYLAGELSLGEDDIYRVPQIVDLRGLNDLIKACDRPDLLHEPWPPMPHPMFARPRDIFAAMRERDFMLHLPYQAFDPVIQLASDAADDDDVLAIKMTLYRVSGRSPIIQALVRAAEAGKQVTALVELKARFDEEANIQWARRLEQAGAHVIYGVAGYKTHAKALLVVRQEEDGIRRYVHLSTGNYNDATARLYTDCGYFTARPEFGADLSAFFNVITGYSVPPKWNRIEMAPTGLRTRLCALIDREIEKHSEETPGRIRIKANAIIDAGVIEALYRASRAGVKIDLVVRGLSRLRAGVEGLSENITLVSILDRFLEHSRIYHFHNGGQDEVYLASADCMERNLDKRLELLFPIHDETCRKELLHIIDVGLADNCHAWDMLPDGSYRRREPAGGEKALRSQEVLYEEARKLVSKRKRGKHQEVFEARRKPSR